MSMYNQLFGVNQYAVQLMYILGYDYTDVGRFRDCFLYRYEGSPHIAIHTRNGGDNRPDYEGVTERLRQHPNYVHDEDDSFDDTYCTYYFSVPNEFKEAVLRMAEDPKAFVDTKERWQNLFKNLKDGNRDDPDVKRAREMGKRIAEQIGKVQDGGVIEV